MALQPTSLSEAATSFSKANDDFVIAQTHFFEKIALYSGGVISVSITFTGYLLSRNAAVFIAPIFGVPLYVILFLGWIFLFFSLLLGIYIELFTARNLQLQFYSEWADFYAKDRKNMFEEVKKGNARVSGVDSTALPEWIDKTESVVKGYFKIAEKVKPKIKIYTFISLYICKATALLFILGCMCVLAFTALSLLHIAL